MSGALKLKQKLASAGKEAAWEVGVGSGPEGAPGGDDLQTPCNWTEWFFSY